MPWRAPKTCAARRSAMTTGFSPTTVTTMARGRDQRSASWSSSHWAAKRPARDMLSSAPLAVTPSLVAARP